MALIDKETAVVAVRDALKPNTTRAIRAMYAIKQLEEVEAIPKETVKAALDEAYTFGCMLGDYDFGFLTAVEYMREKLL